MRVCSLTTALPKVSACSTCLSLLAADESREVLDAFYLGRAVAQTVSERLGAVLGDVLSEVVKISAEQQRAIKYNVATLIAH